MSFSLSELIIVIVVAVLLAKPEDIPILVKHIKKIRSYIKSIFSYIEECLGEKPEKSEVFTDEEIYRINSYIINHTPKSENSKAQNLLEKKKIKPISKHKTGNLDKSQPSPSRQKIVKY